MAATIRAHADRLRTVVMAPTEPDDPTDHHAVPILLLFAGSLAVIALLLVIRQRSPAAHSPRADRAGAVVCSVLTVALVGAWPSATVRGWLGFVDPARCLAKDAPAAGPTDAPAGIEALKADLRLQRLDRGPALDLEVTETVQLDVVTGPDSSGRTLERWGVGGTDLGHPFVLDGRLGLVFGDTFSVPHPSGPGWRSNTLGWVDTVTDDRLEITAMTEARGGRASELLGSLKVEGFEKTVIPTNTTTVGDSIVMHYMSVACWGGHGRWVVRHSGLAVSRDGGQTFQRVDGARFPIDSPFAQVAFAATADDEYVHVFGIPEGREGAVHLARAPTDRLLDLSTWRFWDGESWVADVTEAAQVAPPPAGELSVAWNEHHQRWLMMYLDDLRGGVVMRTAEEPTGPWSRSRLVVSSMEVPTLYAPFLLPGTGTGPEIHYTMSRFDIYNVVLMRSRLEAVGSQSAG